MLEPSKPVNRRRVLAGGTGLIFAGISGCIGEEDPIETDDDDGDPGTPDDSEDDDGIDVERPTYNFLIGNQDPLEDLHWGEYNYTNQIPLRDQIFDRLMQPNFAEDEIQMMPNLVDEIEIDETTLRMHVAQEDGEAKFEWHDGKDFVAEDIGLRFSVDYWYGGQAGFWDLFDIGSDATEYDPRDFWELTDEFTIEFDVAAGVNLDQAAMAYFDAHMWTPPHDGEYPAIIEGFMDATDEDEYDSVRGTLTTYEYHDPIGTGCWEFDRTRGFQVLFTPYEGHPAYEAIQDYDLMVRAFTDRQEIEAFVTGDHDQLNGTFEPDVQERFPDHAEVLEVPGAWGRGILFRHGYESHTFRAKQAFAHFLDWEQIWQARPVPGDLMPNQQMVWPWLTELFIEEPGLDDVFIDYGPESQPEEAEALLEEDGWTKEDDVWVEPNGEVYEPRFVFDPGELEFANIAAVMEHQFDQFGIDADIMSTDDARDRVISTGEFEWGIYEWGGWRMYPTGAVRWAVAEGFNQDVHGFPSSNVEFPRPPVDIGPFEGSGEYDRDDTMTADWLDLYAQTMQETDAEEARELLRAQAWMWNQTIPTLQVDAAYNQYWFVDDRFDIPLDDDQAQVAIPGLWLQKQGMTTLKDD